MEHSCVPHYAIPDREVLSDQNEASKALPPPNVAVATVPQQKAFPHMLVMLLAQMSLLGLLLAL